MEDRLVEVVHVRTGTPESSAPFAVSVNGSGFEQKLTAALARS